MVHPNSEPWPRSDLGNNYALTTGVTITSPDHTWVNPSALWPGAVDDAGLPLGSYFDTSGQLHLHLIAYAGDLSIGVFLSPYNWGGSALIEELETGHGTIYGAFGRWQETVVPEPSCAALLGLGLLALYVKRAANR